MKEIFDDIRKLYLFRDPCQELSEYVEFFSETSLEATRHFIQTDTFSIRLFPSYTPTIWLNLGSPYQLVRDRKTTAVSRARDVLVLRSTTMERQNLASDHIFTIKFRPLGFEAVFGISQATIGNDIINAKEILGAELIQKIKARDTLQGKAALLETIFLEKIRRNAKTRFHLTCIQHAIEHFTVNDLDLKIAALAAQLFVSEKTLYRYFTKAIGTNPKEYFILSRCRAALSAYVKPKPGFSVFDFGYYDFAHFSKEVKRFTGSTLTANTNNK